MEIKFMRIRNIIYAAAATLLAACTNSDEMPTPGTVALQVNATITNANTRLGFSGTTFASGKAISLFADDGTTSSGTATPITYTANASSSANTGGDASSKAAFSPVSGSGYLFNTENDVKFTAIYPAITSDGGSFSVTSDGNLSNTSGGNISTATQSDDLDILFAEGEASIFDPELKLTFSHVMAKLTFNLAAGDGFDATEVQGATVELTSIITDATFNTATGTLTPATTKGEVTANVTSSSSADYAAIAEAIVIPQSEEATFNLKVTYNGMSYTKRLTIKLEAGNNYVYPVTLNKQSLTVGSASIADWDNVEVEDAVRMKYQPYYQIITNKADVQKYDYLLNDGTFMRVSTDNLTKLTDTDKANIAGVVFWTKADKVEGCPDLSTDGQLSEDLQHGLVVSAKAGVSTMWISESITVGVTKENINVLNGYSNTLRLKDYNESNPTYPVLAVSVFADEKEVTGTSGWYLPSPREVIYLYGGTTIGSSMTFSLNYSELDKYLTNKLEYEYWTSVERNNDGYVYYVSSTMNGYYGYWTKTLKYTVRPICAF
jgi:hypothetical protein